MLKTTYKIENGLLSGSQWCPSPNYNERPPFNENSLNHDRLAASIDLLVIHNISLPPAQFENGYIQAFFQNCLPVNEHPYFAEISDLTVSAHLLITRDGTVVQFVNFNDRAWHAGLSCFRGRANCNDFSIGIEMEGTDDLPYSYQQYQVLAAVTCAIQVAYPAISTDSIAGHCDIAPGRKTDPGDSFNWPYYFQLMRSDDERIFVDDHNSLFKDRYLDESGFKKSDFHNPGLNEPSLNDTGVNRPNAKE